MSSVFEGRTTPLFVGQHLTVSLGEAVGAALRPVVALVRRRATERALGALDDRQLWDIGVAWGDIRLVAANQNDWRPAA
jgi:uncharacterized protein YjiS (DUF1127 family)